MTGSSTYPSVLLANDESASGSVSLALVAGLSSVVLVGLWFSGQAQLLRIALPALGTLVGLVLYFQLPVLFVQYSLWVWFLAPLVRRVVDWRFGFVEPNFVLLTPLLVSAVAGLSLLPSSRRADPRPAAALVLCAAGILYGFAVGMLIRPSAETVFGLATWLSPLLLGLHLYATWPRYEQYQSAISRTFIWAALFLGLYGVYQFFLPPSWDRYWLESVYATNQSFGLPEPLQVRVWSTVNAPGPFANVMVAALLLLVVVRSPIRLPAAVAGYLSLLLSVVRTAWLSWLLGFFWLLKSSKPRVLVRVFLSLLLLVLCLLPLINDPRMAPLIGDRLNTFTDLGHDASFEARIDMYKLLVQDAIDHPFGHGLSNLTVSHGVAVDSGILAMLFSLGWMGSAIFAVGIFLLFTVSRHGPDGDDQFSKAAKAIMIALLAQIIGGSVFVSVTGAMFWVFAGMYLAAPRYYSAQPGSEATDG